METQKHFPARSHLRLLRYCILITLKIETTSPFVGVVVILTVEWSIPLSTERLCDISASS